MRHLPHADIWPSILLQLHVGSDLVTALGYLIMAIVLVWAEAATWRYIPWKFRSVLFLCGAWISLAAVGRILDVACQWVNQWYWVSGYWKAITATAVAFTAVVVIKVGRNFVDRTKATAGNG